MPQATAHPSRYWADHSTAHFQALQTSGRIAQTIAVLPVAATEQHGPHLPISTDTAIIDGVGSDRLRVCAYHIPQVSGVPTPAAALGRLSLLEVLDLGTPVVTLPSRQPLRRLVGGVLGRMRLTEALVARSVEEMVRLAVALATDPAHRKRVKQAVPLSRQVLMHAATDCDLDSAEGRVRLLAQALKAAPPALLDVFMRNMSKRAGRNRVTLETQMPPLAATNAA